mmetsp:Transcript_27414/g.63715  ORF Transcript_27414/g.63715 Transcript_27414/m.63715 type:complete len:278 (+) Transcript_27414:1011-1844(+)
MTRSAFCRTFRSERHSLWAMVVITGTVLHLFAGRAPMRRIARKVRVPMMVMSTTFAVPMRGIVQDFEGMYHRHRNNSRIQEFVTTTTTFVTRKAPSHLRAMKADSGTGMRKFWSAETESFLPNAERAATMETIIRFTVPAGQIAQVVPMALGMTPLIRIAFANSLRKSSFSPTRGQRCREKTMRSLSDSPNSSTTMGSLSKGTVVMTHPPTRSSSRLLCTFPVLPVPIPPATMSSTLIARGRKAGGGSALWASSPQLGAGGWARPNGSRRRARSPLS